MTDKNRAFTYQMTEYVSNPGTFNKMVDLLEADAYPYVYKRNKDGYYAVYTQGKYLTDVY